MKWGRQADIRQRNRQIDRMSDGLAAIGELSNYDNNHRHVHQRVTIGLVYGTCMYDRKPMKIVMIWNKLLLLRVRPRIDFYVIKCSSINIIISLQLEWILIDYSSVYWHRISFCWHCHRRNACDMCVLKSVLCLKCPKNRHTREWICTFSNSGRSVTRQWMTTWVEPCNHIIFHFKMISILWVIPFP